jgi:small-conductance mechanosensitive channel
MANGRPGDSIHHDIVHHGREVFGPSCDALVREITARLPEARRVEFQHLVETWPFESDGRPRDPDALFARLVAFRDSLGRPRGSPLGLVLGALVGLPAGFLAYLIARETVLPTALWSSDGVMWAVILLVTAGAALAGWRLRRALRALVGFLLGGIAAGVLATLAAFAIGEAVGVSQREGAFAMGVVFGLAPLAALVGGVAAAVWAGWVRPGGGRSSGGRPGAGR